MKPFFCVALVLIGFGAIACENRDPLPPMAQPELVEMLRADAATSPHPADGGGSGRLVAELSDVPAVASRPGRWVVEYQVGPRGIDVGGMLFLQVSPFWGWSTPQVTSPAAPGFTEVSASARDVDLEPETVDRQLLGITVLGRRLEEGDVVRIVYGAGPAGAYADRYAESESRFWLAVDGNGDGRREIVEDSPLVRVLAGDAVSVVVHLPATARPGERVHATVAMLDPAGNRATGFTGAVELSSAVPISGWPRPLYLRPGDRGARRVAFEVPNAGVVRVTADVAADMSAVSNPLVVGEEPSILWADLHGHSGLSDGTGSPEDYLTYAREVAALDVVALTDHDHWGLRPLAENSDIWEEIGRQVELFDEPGLFVALRGFEWTNWIYGHRHVIYFTAEGDVLSSIDPRFEHPRQLWDALRGRETLTLAHHSAGGPVATDWRIAPDEQLETVTEVSSVHGSSEAPDSPSSIYNPLPGNFVRDALSRGYRLGFVGSGDSHDGHPGLVHVTSPRMGGMAAILAEEKTRSSVLAALRSRRSYATNGPRIVLRASLDARQMGSVVRAADASRLEVSAFGAAPLRVLEIVRTGRIVDAVRCGSALDCAASFSLLDLGAGEYVYVRALQEDGGAAWSSPFFID